MPHKPGHKKKPTSSPAAAKKLTPDDPLTAARKKRQRQSGGGVAQNPFTGRQQSTTGRDVVGTAQPGTPRKTPEGRLIQDGSITSPPKGKGLEAQGLAGPSRFRDDPQVADREAEINRQIAEQSLLDQRLNQNLDPNQFQSQEQQPGLQQEETELGSLPFPDLPAESIANTGEIGFGDALGLVPGGAVLKTAGGKIISRFGTKAETYIANKGLNNPNVIDAASGKILQTTLSGKPAFRVNTKTASKISSALGKAVIGLKNPKVILGAIISTLSLGGSAAGFKAWGEWAEGEGLDGLGIAQSQAINDGQLEEAEVISEIISETHDAMLENSILDWTPIGVFRGNKVKFTASQKLQEVNDEKVRKAREKELTGVDPDFNEQTQQLIKRDEERAAASGTRTREFSLRERAEARTRERPE